MRASVEVVQYKLGVCVCVSASMIQGQKLHFIILSLDVIYGQRADLFRSFRFLCDSYM